MITKLYLHLYYVLLLKNRNINDDRFNGTFKIMYFYNIKIYLQLYYIRITDGTVLSISNSHTGYH